MGLLLNLQNRIRKLLNRDNDSIFDRKDFWKDAYSDIILRYGTDAPGDTLENARKIGLNVNALIAEHERRKAASWCIEFSFDLENLDDQDLHLLEKLKQAGIPDRDIHTQGGTLEVHINDLYKGVELPNEVMQMPWLVMQGARALQQRFMDKIDEFPKNRYPHGVSDWKLTSLRRSEGSQKFYLSGGWKTEVLDKKPSKLQPAQSIDLRRVPPTEKQLVSSRRFPKLEQVTLSVCRWPCGKHQVEGVFSDEASSPAPRQASDPDLSDTLRIAFPSGDLPALEWHGVWSDYQTPATAFLQRHCIQQAGKSENWLHPYSVEALIVNHADAMPALDLRASLVSGPTGPAPLPNGTDWPCCPSCGEPSLFSQSIDVRDVSFADMLPGTSIVVFACNDCLDAGEWQNCSRVIWLGATDEIVLVDRGDPASLIQWSQWYASDLPLIYDLPQEIQNELDECNKLLGNPNAYYPPSYGTKVGGVPHYLQSEAVFYDRNGIVMEYIAQISTPLHISAGGFGYVSHSVATGETYIDFQNT
jgi:hypothetical protein